MATAEIVTAALAASIAIDESIAARRDIYDASILERDEKVKAEKEAKEAPMTARHSSLANDSDGDQSFDDNDRYFVCVCVCVCVCS